MERLIVTGFVPIPDHPRDETTYRRLGDKLTNGLAQRGHRLNITHGEPNNTMLGKLLAGHDRVFKPATADNPAKNSLTYHCVQHEKFAWLSAAHTVWTEFDQYIWLDYGILHVPGVTVEVISEALHHAADFGVVTIPGCWPDTKQAIPLMHPCWRFCGGLMVVPKTLVKPFAGAAITAAMKNALITGVVNWEVNSLAQVERGAEIPIRWYQADHDQTMFTNIPRNK